MWLRQSYNQNLEHNGNLKCYDYYLVLMLILMVFELTSALVPYHHYNIFEKMPQKMPKKYVTPWDTN